MNTAFTVKIGVFEGPLDLLLSLVEERKMHISEVSLSAVAEDFISYVKNQPAFPIGEASQFIVVAATLLLIKSKALLPALTLTMEEEGDIRDLEHRLALYQIFRNSAKQLASFLGTRLYFGGLCRDRTPLFAPAPDMTADELASAMERALSSAPKIEQRKEVTVRPVISLEEMMGRLTERIERTLSTTFKDFVGNAEDKREIAVGFLAVLELVKQGILLVEQHGKYADITLEYTGTPKAPRYE